MTPEEHAILCDLVGEASMATELQAASLRRLRAFLAELAPEDAEELEGQQEATQAASWPVCGSLEVPLAHSTPKASSPRNVTPIGSRSRSDKGNDILRQIVQEQAQAKQTPLTFGEGDDEESD